MIYPAGRYNLSFDICSAVICAFLLLYLAIAGNLRVRRTRSFFWVVLCILLCSCGLVGPYHRRRVAGVLKIANIRLPRSCCFSIRCSWFVPPCTLAVRFLRALAR